jgi:phytanoyl-CoA hydroxylase
VLDPDMTETDAILDDEQIAHYWREGYVVAEGLVPRDRLERLDRRFCELVEHPELRHPEMVVMRDVMVVRGAVEAASALHATNKMISFEDDPILWDYAVDPALVGAVRCLLGSELYTLSTNVFNKPPGVDGRHPYHQDLRYFRIRPADGIVGTWTAILPATRESGCLSVLPRSHQGALLDHDYPDWEHVNHGFYGVSGIDTEARVHVELQPGDTLLFHPLLIHGSGRNRSSDFRRAISAHYAAGACTSPRGDWHVGKRVRRVPEPR